MVNKYVDELFPITLPYTGDNKYSVYVRQALSDSNLKKYTDWDIEGIYYIRNENTGEITHIEEFFKWINIGTDKEERVKISHSEFNQLYYNIIR